MASKATIDADITLSDDLATILAKTIDTSHTYADILNVSLTSSAYDAGDTADRVTEEWGMAHNAIVRTFWPHVKLVSDNFTDSGSAVDCTVPFSASTLTSDAQVVAGTNSYVEINGVRHYSGSGSPNGSLSANEGSVYTDSSTGYRYRNTSSGSGTTWTSMDRVGWSMAGYNPSYASTTRFYFDWYDTSALIRCSGGESARVGLWVNGVEVAFSTGIGSSAGELVTFDYDVSQGDEVALAITPGFSISRTWHALLQGYRLLG